MDLVPRKLVFKSVSQCTEQWYRVSGTKQNPKFERVVLWAVLTLIEHHEDNEYTSDYVAGLVDHEIGVGGLDYADILGVAGYTRTDHVEDAADLVWDD